CLVLRVLAGRGPRAKGELEQAFASGIPVEGVVTGVNKGGVEVQVAGTRAFCPVSQLDLRHTADPAQFVGQRLQFRITKLETAGRHLNIVVSRRVLLEEKARELAAVTRAKLSVGAVVSGRVVTIQEYGAFVDLGGLEGLLHKSELGFGRIASVGEV